MANVTIKLTVDTVAIKNDPLSPDLGTNCRLSQSGGEELGNCMCVDPADSTQNISYVTENDVITWIGIPANGDLDSQVNIMTITKDIGSASILGIPLNTSWSFGKTVIRQVIQHSADDEERYTITFTIGSGKDQKIYELDPKIKGHIPPILTSKR